MTALLDGLPVDVESERHLLACTMVGGEQIATLSGLVSATDFYREANAAAWSAALSLWESGEEINQMTLAHTLSLRGQLELVDGLSGLARLIHECPATMPEAAAWYAKQVRQTSMARRIISTSLRLAEMARSDPETSEETLERGISMLADLARRASERDAQTAHEVLYSGLFDELEQRMDAPWKLRGMSTGLHALDVLWDGLVRTCVYVVAAETSAGKSLFVQDRILWLAEQGQRCLYFSTEMSNRSTGRRMVHMLAGVDPFYARLRGQYGDDEKHRIRRAMSDFDRLPVVFDDRGDLSFGHIRNAVRRHKSQGGVDLVVVDHLDMMSGDSDSRTREMELITKGLKQVAMDQEVALIEVSQLSRATDRQRSKLDRLRNSGSKSMDADVVAFLEAVALQPQADGSMRWEPVAPDEAKRLMGKNQGVHVQLETTKSREGATGGVMTYLDWSKGGRFFPVEGV